MAVEGLIRGRVGADRAAEKAMIQQLTGTESGWQVLFNQLTGADQAADRC